MVVFSRWRYEIESDKENVLSKWKSGCRSCATLSLLLASDYSYTELEGIDGKFRLKDDIHARVNAVLEPIRLDVSTLRSLWFSD